MTRPVVFRSLQKMSPRRFLPVANARLCMIYRSDRSTEVLGQLSGRFSKRNVLKFNWDHLYDIPTSHPSSFSTGDSGRSQSGETGSLWFCWRGGVRTVEGCRGAENEWNKEARWYGGGGLRSDSSVAKAWSVRLVLLRKPQTTTYHAMIH